MAKILAVVRLAPGQVAFYDETTGTHLTMGNPQAEVYEHMNTRRIKRAVSNKILNLVAGSFNTENTTVKEKKVDIEVKVKEPEKKKPAKDIKPIEEKIAEEVIEKEVPVENPVVEEITEENIETSEVNNETETDKPKNKRKKKEE